MENTALAAMLAVLWAYIVSNYLFRVWYMAAAAALVVVALLIVARMVRADGAGRAIAPVIVYFAVLLGSASWATFPADTVRWVAIDSIGIAVFALAFVAGRHTTPGSMANGLMTLVIPALVMTATMYAIDPAVPRIAQYAVALLPFVTPFAYWRAVTARPRWPGVLTLAIIFAILVFGRSRTHLATAVLLTLISAFLFRKNVREALTTGAAIVAAIAVLVLIPITQSTTADSFVRIAGEPVNPQRVALAEVSRSLLQETMPLGIGYGNFVRRFHGVTGHELQIHNVYVAWLLEGGVLCVAVVLLLAVAHIRALSLYIRSAPAIEQRIYGQMCAIASIGILTIGVFHQVHQTPALWMILGLGAACGAEARSWRKASAVDAVPLLDRWRRSNPPFAPALCEPLMATALRHLSQCEPGSFVADIGCGTGSMVRALKDGGYRAIGIDADTAVLNGPAAIAGQGEQLPLRSGAVNGIFVFSAFQYMDRTRALEECRRVLEPGGRFVTVENLAGNPIAKLSRVMRRIRSIGYPRHLEPRAHLQWRDRAIYELYFSDVIYEVHHVLSPLFLFSRALEFRVFIAALRVVQRLERRALSAGWFSGAAWHVVITGRK
jgi:SAM-dependent methyltransferase